MPDEVLDSKRRTGLAGHIGHIQEPPRERGAGHNCPDKGIVMDADWRRAVAWPLAGVFILVLGTPVQAGEEDALVVWARAVSASHVDMARADLPFPECVDVEHGLGAPDGNTARIILHNGWNDWGEITFDLHHEVSWGDLVLVYRQEGPGAAKSTSLDTAGEDGDFRLLSRVELSEEIQEYVFPLDRPTRYVRVRAYAGGGVPTDSVWYIDAVGVRTGRAALQRTRDLEARAEALSVLLEKHGSTLPEKHVSAAGEARARLRRVFEGIHGLDGMAVDALPQALQKMDRELDIVDAAVLRLSGAQHFAVFNGGRAPEYMASWAPSLTKLRPGSPVRASELRFDGAMALARNEHESLQLVVMGGDVPLEDVSISMTPLTHVGTGEAIAAEHVQIEQVRFVQVNNDLWPDPIVPLESLALPAGARQSVWIRAYAPDDAGAGEYESIVTVAPKNAHPVEMPLRVRVYDFALPVHAHTRHVISCGGGGLDEVLLRYRASTGGGPCTGSVAEPRYILHADGSMAMDFAEYDAVMTQAFAMGLTAFGLPLSCGDGGGLIAARLHRTFFDEARNERVDVSLNPIDGPEAKARMLEWLRLFCGHLKTKGWFDRSFFYLWDEPAVEHGEQLVAIGRAVREAVPDLKIMCVSFEPLAPWHEVVDIYCPPVGWYAREHIEARLAELRALGKEMWWYNCGDPAPLPTYSISQPGACARMSFLLMWQYGVTGNLYWAAEVNNTLRDTVPENPGADGRGDGQLVYRLHDGGAVPSLRLELIRDGIEDYEYLAILKERIGAARERGEDVARYEALLTLPDTLAESMDTYAHNPAVFEGWRRSVAEAIEGLGE